MALRRRDSGNLQSQVMLWENDGIVGRIEMSRGKSGFFSSPVIEELRTNKEKEPKWDKSKSSSPRLGYIHVLNRKFS